MNVRQQLLIIKALFLLEMEQELDGISDPEEIQNLINNIKLWPIRVQLLDLPDHLAQVIRCYRWDVWENDPWDYDVGERDSVIESYIGPNLIKEIDVCLQDMGIKHARFHQ